MASNTNIYAKSYKIDSRPQKDDKNDKYAFISYLDDPNTFSVVAFKRLIGVDQFGKGSIREQNKTYRISVERTGNKVEMEDLAMETEQSCAYTMNTEVVSDTEEWHRRKRSTTSKNQEQTSNADKQLNDLCCFDDDEPRTYTTLTLLDEVRMLGANDQASSDEDDDEDDEKFDDDDDDHQENNNQRKNMSKNTRSTNSLIGLNRKSTSTRKKRSSTATGQEPTAKRVLVDNNSSTFTYENQSTVLQSSSSSCANELNSSITQMRKQIFALSQTVEKQNKLQLEILHNQKKMTKAMRHNNIPVMLESETSTSASLTDANTASITCKEVNGDEIDLVQLPYDRTRPNTFVLACATKLFKEEEIVNMNARALDTDPRVLMIRKAVQIKFGLNNTQTTTVWTSMLRSIKSRRRNTMARARKNNNNHNNNNDNNNNNNNDDDDDSNNTSALQHP